MYHQRASEEWEAEDLPRSMPVDTAQQTICVRVPNLLSADEIDALEATIHSAQSEGQFFGVEWLMNDASVLSLCCRRRHRGGWRKLFLQTNGWFPRALPRLRQKLLAAACRADAEQGWGLLSAPDAAQPLGDDAVSSAATPATADSTIKGDEINEETEHLLSAVEVPTAPEGVQLETCGEAQGEDEEEQASRRCKALGCNVRVAEYHRHEAPSPALPDREHHDLGSLVTIDVMLSDSASSFQGGEFQTLEANGRMQGYSFSRGDALIFVSHKYHCVQPVLAGERKVLILEFWRGPECRCAHRCRAEWPRRFCKRAPAREPGEEA